MRFIACVVLLVLNACSVLQETALEIERTAPDGTKVAAKFKRTWASGPVDASATYNPATGIVTFHWQSDVNLDAATAASQAQVQAQVESLQALGPLLGDILKTLIGIKEGPPTALRSAPEPPKCKEGP